MVSGMEWQVHRPFVVARILTRTYEAAYDLLSAIDAQWTAESTHVVEKLTVFVDQNKQSLIEFYNPWPQVDNNPKPLEGPQYESIDATVKEEAYNLAKLLKIGTNHALRTVERLERLGVQSDNNYNRTAQYVRSYLSERRHIIKLVSLMLKNRNVDTESENVIRDIGEDVVTDIIADRRILKNAMKQVVAEMEQLDQNNGTGDSAVDDIIREEFELVNAIFVVISAVLPDTTELIDEWMQVIKLTNFFAGARDDVLALCTLTTIGMLDLNHIPSKFGGPTLKVIHDILGNSSVRRYDKASPVLLAWVFVVNAIAQFGDLEGQQGDDNNNNINNNYNNEYNNEYDPMAITSHLSPEETKTLGQAFVQLTKLVQPRDPAAVPISLSKYVTDLASDVISLGAIDQFARIFEILPHRIEYANMGTTLLLAALPYFKMTEDIAKIVHVVISRYPELCKRFFEDELGSKVLLLSQAKVPVAHQPFIWLSRCLGADAIETLNHMKTYMEELPKTFRQYEFPDPSRNWIINLLAPLTLMESRDTQRGADGELFTEPGSNTRDRIYSKNGDDGSIVLAPGSVGEIVSRAGTTTVVMWHIEYNGWQLLGRLLEKAHLERTWDERCIGIVDLITDTLSHEMIELEDKQAMLISLSDSVADNADCIKIILDELDDALYNRDTIMCCAGIRFLTGLLTVDPQRVWAYLGRSPFRDDRSGKAYSRSLSGARAGANGNVLMILIREAEISERRFDVSQRIIELADALVKDCLLKSLDRDDRVSDEVVRSVLNGIVEHLISIYEGCSHWAYKNNRQKTQLSMGVLGVLTLVLFSMLRVFSRDETITTTTTTSLVAHKTANPTFPNLMPAVMTIVDQFLGQRVQTVLPLLSSIEWAARSVDVPSEETLNYIKVVLMFCTVGVKARTQLQQNKCSHLEQQLFARSKDLTMIYVRYFCLHEPVLNLLEALVASPWPEEQPSLLAYLGSDHAQILRCCVTEMVSSGLEHDSAVISMCQWFKAVMGSKQQGFCILLLSGEETGGGLNKSKAASSIKKSDRSAGFLAAIENRVTESDIPNRVLERLLDAVTVAYSTWTLSRTQENSKLHAALRKFISSAYKLKSSTPKGSVAAAISPLKSSPFRTAGTRSPAARSSSPSAGSSSALDSRSDDVENSYTIIIAAHALRILAVELYRNPNDKDIKEFLAELNQPGMLVQYCDIFFKVGGYRASLHSNMHRNLSRVWKNSPVKLNNFIGSPLLAPRRYGPGFYYDIGLLDIVLLGRPQWSESYRDEVALVNYNLSYIDSQLGLVDAWSSFLTVWSDTEQLDQVILSALEATKDEIAVPLLRGAVGRRLDVVFCVMMARKRLPSSSSKQKSRSPKILDILLDLLADPAVDFVNNVALTDETCWTVYRKILHAITLQLDEESYERPVIHELLELVTIKAMKALIIAIPQNPNAHVSDFVEITTILRKCLKLTGDNPALGQLAIVMSETGCDRAVMGLFANALEMCIPDGNGGWDPVYGELALIYILEWLLVDTMADRFVMNGLFSVIHESKLCTLIQNGVTARSDPRLFDVWSKGILAIVLMLLRRLGAQIVSEVIVFIRKYGSQITYSLKAWAGDAVEVSLAGIEETYQLFLLFDLVDRLADSALVERALPKPPRMEVIECIEYLLSHQKLLQTRLIIPRTIDVQTVLPDVVAGLQDLREFLRY